MLSDQVFAQPVALDFPLLPGGEVRSRLLLLDLLPSLLDSVAEEVDALEAASYENARRGTAAELDVILRAGGAIATAAFLGNALAGISVAAPLEHFGHVAGPFDDSEFGKGSTIYFVDTTVGVSVRGMGLGRLLKTTQLSRAYKLGYRFATGRVRAGLGDPMLALNRSLGAQVLFSIAPAYHDDITPDEALYYRIALNASSL
jgi:predicted GNAT superfamily acetyltransferase